MVTKANIKDLMSWEGEGPTRRFSIPPSSEAPIAPREERDCTPALTAIQGQALGKVFKIRTSEVILGRTSDAHIAIFDEGVSRQHAKISHSDGQCTLFDLESTNGTFVNDQKITSPVCLQNGDVVRIGATAAFRFCLWDEVDERMQEALYELATRDALTQAYNRRYFEDKLASEWSWARRHGRPCALCAIDVDHFKRVNDQFGHPAGDFVLTELVRIVKILIRKEDAFARVGGEEFFLLARATDEAAGLRMAERVRSAVELHEFKFSEHRLPITISLGVSTSAHPFVSNPAEFVAHADAALYQAKRAGRNRVSVASAEPSSEPSPCVSMPVPASREPPATPPVDSETRR